MKIHLSFFIWLAAFVLQVVSFLEPLELIENAHQRLEAKSIADRQEFELKGSC